MTKIEVVSMEISEQKVVPGEVRTDDEGNIILVIMTGNPVVNFRDMVIYNAICLEGCGVLKLFETVYGSNVKGERIATENPYVMDAKITIGGENK